MKYCSRNYTLDQEIEEKFDLLVDCVQHCRLCKGMETRTKVFSEFNGNIHSNLLIIAEAPGRLGADRTAIPLFGDQTGVNFQRIIDTVGWTREDFFITNAILCNPRDHNGNNTTPHKEHIINCSPFLDTLIKIMAPEYVITLGQKALEALQLICPVNVTLKSSVRQIIEWKGCFLIPLYHTGPRAMVHRNFYNQLSDFYWAKQKIKLRVKPWDRIKKSGLLTYVNNEGFCLSKIQKTIIEVLGINGPCTRFQLTKLLYLIDYNFISTNAKPLTNGFYLRAYDGPLPMGLDKELSVLFDKKILIDKQNYICLSKKPKVSFQKNELETIKYVLEKYGNLSNGQIKTVTYMTTPMRRILRREKKGENMNWKPIFTEADFVKK